MPAVEALDCKGEMRLADSCVDDRQVVGNPAGIARCGGAELCGQHILYRRKHSFDARRGDALGSQQEASEWFKAAWQVAVDSAKCRRRLAGESCDIGADSEFALGKWQRNPRTDAPTPPFD